MQGLKKIHIRNLITKKNFCGSKIPPPPPLPPCWTKTGNLESGNGITETEMEMEYGIKYH